MSALVIIPTFNERDNLPALVEAILSLDAGLHVLIVDDGSPDGTGEIADRLARETGRVSVLKRSGKQGLGTAYVAGFRYALSHDFDLVVEMDADFSHRPEDLPRLIAAAKEADVVIGSRNVPGGRVVGWSPLRQLVSKGGSIYARLLLGLPVADCTSGFKCFRRSALQILDLDALRSNGYAFQVEVNFACAQAGLRFAEVPIVFPDRARGKSKMSWHIAAEAAWLVLRFRMGLSQPPILSAAVGG
ncbi:MAG TPA: polyprenol monophosphomannose synthase [Chloroflexota bacterium]|nr:polyprenol monophosphomannose synthase [Chloroflexota bacterium]